MNSAFHESEKTETNKLLQELSEEVRELRTELRRIKEDTNVMVHHVWFINSVYERFREPVNTVLNVMAKLGNLFVVDYDQNQNVYLSPMVDVKHHLDLDRSSPDEEH